MSASFLHARSTPMAAVTCPVSDYYEILEVPRNASAEDIKRKYQQLIKKVAVRKIKCF